MKQSDVEKAGKLLEEIKEMKKYKSFLSRDNKHKDVVHFEIRNHYGNCNEWETAKIDERFNKRLFTRRDTR